MYKYNNIDDFLKAADLLPGGKSDDKHIPLPKDELERGLQVESEHTKNPKIEREIVDDHEYEAIHELSGKPNYYEYLKDMENKMKEDKKSSYVEFPQNYPILKNNKKVNKSNSVNIPKDSHKNNPNQEKHQNKKDNKFDEMLENEITKGTKFDKYSDYTNDLLKFSGLTKEVFQKGVDTELNLILEPYATNAKTDMDTIDFSPLDMNMLITEILKDDIQRTPNLNMRNNLDYEVKKRYNNDYIKSRTISEFNNNLNKLWEQFGNKLQPNIKTQIINKFKEYLDTVDFVQIMKNIPIQTLLNN